MFKNPKIFKITLLILFLSLIIPFLTFGQTLNYDEQIIKVKNCISSGNFIEAETILKELEKFYPNNSEILFLLGEVLFWQKKYEESLNYLLKSYAITKSEDIKKEIEKVETAKLLDQAKKYQDEGNIEAAKKIYQELFFSKKNLYESGYNLGMIYLKEKDYQSAVSIFEKLISLYPEDLGFKELYIETLILNRKIDEAKKYLYAQQEEIKEKIYQRRKDLFCRLKTNNFKFYYSYFDLSPSYRKSEKEYGVEVSQHLNQWVFLISAKKFERFGLEDNQLYMEIYPYLGKTRWGYLSFSYSPDASFLPKTTYGFEVFQGLSKFEISFGYNHMSFKDSNVDMFFPGFILYLPKDFILEEKLYLVPKTDSYSFVTTISKEVVCKFLVKYSFGFGTISERLTTLSDIQKFSSYFHLFETEYRFKENFSIGLDFLYENRENLYTRRGLGLFLRYWW